MKGDGVFRARAVFYVPGTGDSESAAYLRRFYRLVPVENGTAVSRFCRAEAIEIYASWRVGVETEDDLPLLSARSLRGVRAAEERSRIIVDIARLARIVEAARNRGKRIVFTNGVFDLVHVGHLRLLERARALGDVLIVGINSDDSARRIKGAARPVVPQFARAEALMALRSVDWCFIFTEDDPRKVLSIVKPAVLAKGSDYGPREVVGAGLVTRHGGRVERLPLVRGCSTTSTIVSIQRRARRDAGSGRR